MSAAIPGGAAEQKIRTMKIGDRASCISAQIAFGEDGLATEAGVQTPHDRFKMPKGVGAKYYGGQYLIFDYHFLNTTTDTIHALSAANLRIAPDVCSTGKCQPLAVEVTLTRVRSPSVAASRAAWTSRLA